MFALGSPTFDIVIPTYGRSDSLRRTLLALSEQDIPTGLDVVHVVENGARLGAETVCGEFQMRLPIRYHFLNSPGAGGARNVGVKNSYAEFVVFFDNDVRPVPGALASYAEAFSKLGEDFFFGGPLIPDYEQTPSDWLIEFLPNSARGFSLGDRETAISGPDFIGSNFAAPRAMIEHAGCFEGPCATGAAGGGLGEERRLLQRMMTAGHAGVYLPGAGVFHYVPRNRCDVGFLHHRRWRHGYGDGEILAKKIEGKGRMLFGAPAWFWRQTLQSICSLLREVRPGLSKPKIFRELLDVYWHFGRISGFRAASRRHESA